MDIKNLFLLILFCGFLSCKGAVGPQGEQGERGDNGNNSIEKFTLIIGKHDVFESGVMISYSAFQRGAMYDVWMETNGEGLANINHSVVIFDGALVIYTTVDLVGVKLVIFKITSYEEE